MVQGFEFLLHAQQIGEHGHALGEHSAPGKFQAVLRQVAEGDALHGVDAAVVQRLHAGENLEQRGLAGAVRADQADAVVRRKHPVQLLEQDPRAETLARIRKSNHGVISF